MHEFFVVRNSHGSCEFGKANSTCRIYVRDKNLEKTSFSADTCLMGVNHRKTRLWLNNFPFFGMEQKMSTEQLSSNTKIQAILVKGH